MAVRNGCDGRPWPAPLCFIGAYPLELFFSRRFRTFTTEYSKYDWGLDRRLDRHLQKMDGPWRRTVSFNEAQPEDVTPQSSEDIQSCTWNEFHRNSPRCVKLLLSEL